MNLHLHFDYVYLGQPQHFYPPAISNDIAEHKKYYLSTFSLWNLKVTIFSVSNIVLLKTQVV